MGTAPYASDAEDRIRYSARHTITATAYPPAGDPIALDVESATVQFDESWSPRIQASLTCKLPADPAALDALDPRRRVRVTLDAGYVWDSVSDDVHLLADLHLRGRSVKQPDNRLVLRAWSDEGLAQDFRRLSWQAQPPQSDLYSAVLHHAAKSVAPDPAPAVLSDFEPGFGASAVAGVTQDPGQDSWSLLADAADRAGVQVYCDADRTWRIAQLPDLDAETALNLTTGAGGIIIDSEGNYSRDEFYNAVSLKYAWRDAGGVDRVMYGNAYVSGAGPFAVDTIGQMVYFEERKTPATQAQADAAATKALRSMSKRGRGFSMEAISAYWLRPGDPVTATLPESTDQERLLVSSVTFNFPAGSMALRLRRPEDLTISNA